MQVGDLVRIKYDGTVAIAVRIEDGARPWIYLHTGESFKWDKLELINASR